MSLIERSLHSITRLLVGDFGREGGDGSMRSGLVVAGRLVAASIVPVLTTAALWYSRTVVEVTDPEQLHWVQLWLSLQPGAIRRVRRLLLLSTSQGGGSTRTRGRYYNDDPYGGDNPLTEEEAEDRFAPPKLTYLPASGVSAWAWFGCWPVSVSSLGTTVDRNGYSRQEIGYKLTVWFASSGADVASGLLLSGRKLWLAKREKKTEIWLHDTRARYDVATRKSRPLHSVIVEKGIKEKLCEDIKNFLRSEDWYVKKGIPYRRGYLLHGPPGCGKTSLTTALAGALRLPIVLISFGSKNIDDGALLEALSGAPRESLILIEDVDVAFRKQDEMDRYGRQPVTVSGLLNALDGVAAQEGRVVVFTTNHKEVLSEALLRPGRVDAEFYLGHATKSGAGELFDQFFPPFAADNDEMCKKTPYSAETLSEKEQLRLAAKDAFVMEVQPGAHSFARLQGVLMQARDDPALAAVGMCQLFAKKEKESKKANGELDISDGDLDYEEQEAASGQSGGNAVSKRDDDIHAYVSLLEHAASCRGKPGCASVSCKSTKEALEHVTKECSEEPRSKCKRCAFFIMVAMEHRKKCTLKGDGACCPVPFCDKIREKKTKEKEAFVESLFEEKPLESAEKIDSKNGGDDEEEKKD